MVLTVLESFLPPGGEAALLAAYQAGTRDLPPGLVRSELLHDIREPGRWRIQTLWASREAVETLRGSGNSAGVMMFRAAGAEPTLTIFEVTAMAPPPVT
jgi:hypothetical protein